MGGFAHCEWGIRSLYWGRGLYDLAACHFATGVAPKAVRDYIHMAGLSFVGSGAGTDDESGDFADMAYNLGTRNLLGNEVRPQKVCLSS